MKKLKVGIIGAGGISHLHAQGYKALPEVEISAVCDLNLPRAQAWAEKYGVAEAYPGYSEMLEKADIDAVSICIWNNGHCDAAIAALNAGKHVLCEKPMAMNAAEAMRMKAAADKSGKVLMIGFVRRFGMNTELARDFIQNGSVGEVFLAKTSCVRRCGNPGGWFSDITLSGGGPLIDLGVHMIDLCRFLMGKPKAVRVSGAAFSNLGPRNHIKMVDRYKAAGGGEGCTVEDVSMGMIRFENGAILQVETSFSQDIEADRITLELHGKKGGVVLEPKIAFYTEMNDYLVDIVPHVNIEPDVFTGSFRREIAHFVDCVLNGTECLNPPEDGVELMQILDALYASAKAGREVEISELA